MKKQIIAISILLLFVTACSSPRSASSDVVSEVSSVTARESDVQIIQMSPGKVLPPYGVKVQAQAAVVMLRIYTTQKDSAGRVEDIQRAIDEIKALAGKTQTISVSNIAVEQVSGSYARKESSTSNIENLDTSAITLKLTTQLAQHDNDFIKCVAEINHFLNTINLPKTTNVQATSVEADLGDLEPYRSQIIAQVYQELDSVQDTYSKGINFDISGLYDPIKKIQLSDIDYYLYLEPVVAVREF